MKKIMFNDQYGLTRAVLGGTKTMTRRTIKGKTFWHRCPEGMWTHDEIKAWEKECDQRIIELYNSDEWDKVKEWALKKVANYKIGEVVAIAQSYRDAGCDNYFYRKLAGWANKMFVGADEMPHRIKITDIRIERLQDISDEDCLKEGVEMLENIHGDKVYTIHTGSCYTTPKIAFSSLINKTCGRGTWEKNPLVFVYDFELIK